MGNKKIARIRKVICTNRADAEFAKDGHYLAFEAKVGDRWKILLLEPIKENWMIPDAVRHFTHDKRQGKYEFVDCDESEHEW